MIGGLVKGIFGAVVGLAKGILRNKVLRMIATVAIAFIPGGSFGIAALKGFGMGFVSSGGDLRYAIIGAVTGAALHGVGNYFTAGGKTLSLGQHIQKGVAQGMIGGAAHKVSGGRFFAGFLSAGASSAFASSGMYDSSIGAVVAGGTTAVLGGGKFANGAQTAAFSYLFSSAAQARKDPSRFRVGDKDFIIKGGTEAEQLQAQADLRDVFGTPRSGQMLAELESRRFLGIFRTKFTVDLSVTNNAYAYAPGDAVFVDPGFHPNILTTSGIIPATTRRILAHELGHAAFGTLDDGHLRLNNVNQNENPIMKSLGQPSRLRY